MNKRFTRDQGYDEEQLLFGGIDHIYAGVFLLNEGPFSLDSAGYLVQLGFELVFKAILLCQVGEFRDEHNLGRLLAEVARVCQGFSPARPTATLVEKLDRFYELRYPGPRGKVSISTEDFRQIPDALTDVLNQSPERLRHSLGGWRQPAEDGTFRKSGRIAMVRFPRIGEGDLSG